MGGLTYVSLPTKGMMIIPMGFHIILFSRGLNPPVKGDFLFRFAVCHSLVEELSSDQDILCRRRVETWMTVELGLKLLCTPINGSFRSGKV